jgi:hypothetical protein
MEHSVSENGLVSSSGEKLSMYLVRYESIKKRQYQSRGTGIKRDEKYLKGM